MESVLKEKEEEYLMNIKTKEEIIESQSQKIEYLNKDIDFKNKGFTIPQQNLFYYYIFNELGVNFQNSKKKDWAKVISAINGKNEEYVRKALSFNFDDEVTKKDMRILVTTIDNLFPSITQKILNDIEV